MAEHVDENDGFSLARYARGLQGRVAIMKSRRNTLRPESIGVDGMATDDDKQPQLSPITMTEPSPFLSPTKTLSPTKSRATNSTLPRSPGVTSFQQPPFFQQTITDSINTQDTMHESTTPQSPEHLASSRPTSSGVADSPPSSRDGSPWIGGTGLGNSSLGKSGKVIERLMAECDRLKRDLRSEVAKREELQRAAQTHKDRLDVMREENAIMSNAKTMNDNMIKRRDRKIEELKAELQIEKQKRDSLESRALEAEQKVEDMGQQNNEQMQRYMEEAKQATTTAIIFQQSHKQLREEYQQRIATSHRSLKELHDKREEDRRERDRDRKKMAKIDVVNQQMYSELEKTRRAHNDMVAQSDRDREEKAHLIDSLLAEMEGFRETEQRRELDYERKVAQLHETMNQMKWVMAVKKVSDEKGLHSPPPSPPG